MAHVHVPFQVEEVSLLTITKVYDRQSPAKLKGTEKNKQKNRQATPSPQLTSEKVLYKFIFLFLLKKECLFENILDDNFLNSLKSVSYYEVIHVRS